MGNRKFKRPILAEYVSSVQALTGASTGTVVTNHGVTKFTVAAGSESVTAAKYTYTLENPRIGVHKTIVFDNNSTRTLELRTGSSLATFFGSTKNAIAVTTGSTATNVHVDLVGVSSVQWAVKSISSTAISVVGATA
jgi:hypothetical protein